MTSHGEISIAIERLPYMAVIYNEKIAGFRREVFQ
jgi:hypothetical protein